MLYHEDAAQIPDEVDQLKVDAHVASLKLYINYKPQIIDVRQEKILDRKYETPEIESRVLSLVDVDQIILNEKHQVLVYMRSDKVVRLWSIEKNEPLGSIANAELGQVLNIVTAGDLVYTVVQDAIYAYNITVICSAFANLR